ncbi:MAG TPA: hypothetical protein VFP63_05090 [Dehalococcoidia bacterium]|nr:hypothetical protein [Dehalococcoidia bacterium]
MIGPLLKHPLRAAIIFGIFVAIVFGAISFPAEKRIEKTVDGWLPANASDDPVVIDDLIESLESARRENGDVVTVSEERFRELDLPLAHAFTEATDGDSAFAIKYVGKESEQSGTVYVAERKVSAGPWWSPDRIMYRAFRAETTQLGNVLRLTFERDLEGLFGLLLLDLLVGGIYGTLAGLIVAALNSTGLNLPGERETLRRLPPETPLDALGRGERV